MQAAEPRTKAYKWPRRATKLRAPREGPGGGAGTPGLVSIHRGSVLNSERTLDTDREPVDGNRERQRVRSRRVLWALLSYGISYVVILVCYELDFLPARTLIVYPGMALAITALFLLAIRSGINRRFADPSMTLPQMIAALAPWGYTLFEYLEPHSRGLAVILSLVTLLYGLLALDRRRMMIMSTLTILVYLAVLSLIAWVRPQDLNPIFDGLWALGLVIVVLQLSWIGGYVSELRLSLRERNAELHTLATQDMLTRLPNRRYLLQRLSAEVARSSRREHRPGNVTVCLIDLDEFKRINDTLGHGVGDAVLQAVAERMQTALRESDCLGRFGGEEFLAILPDTDNAGGEAMAQRIRATLAGVSIPELPAGWRITATVGVAESRPDERLEDTLARADEALYEGKRAGRDQVRVAPA
jgi:diguanylate cyclase